ncbi:MAG: hypothetical protein O7A69_09130, partial [SAR324 cluster bacterium]|nr:hypothetical protein [SAR324 cluster bacterium]
MFNTLANEGYPEAKANFFGLNAIEYLGLAKSTSGVNNRERLDKYYGSKQTAAWRDRVDAVVS